MNSPDFRRQATEKARRRQRSRTARSKLWSGLGLVGSVGWMVALPTVAGVFLGRMLDTRLETQPAFTLGLMLLGLTCGGYTVWRFFLRDIT